MRSHQPAHSLPRTRCGLLRSSCNGSVMCWARECVCRAIAIFLCSVGRCAKHVTIDSSAHVSPRLLPLPRPLFRANIGQVQEAFPTLGSLSSFPLVVEAAPALRLCCHVCYCLFSFPASLAPAIFLLHSYLHSLPLLHHYPLLLNTHNSLCEHSCIPSCPRYSFYLHCPGASFLCGSTPPPRRYHLRYDCSNWHL